MWNLIKKELRQNLPWFAIGFIAMLHVIRSFFMTDSDGSFRPVLFIHYYTSSSLILPLTNDAFLLTLGVFASVYGFALGLLQTFPEEAARTYAFYLAKPTRRPNVVGAKLVVGALLYFLATAIPFCSAIYWTSIPGHFASPFRFYMSYPGFMVICTVFLFYLGGFLTGVRPARWLGSRLVGLAAALAAAPVLCRMELYEMEHAVLLVIPLLILVLLIVLFIWAIQASFIEREF